VAAADGVVLSANDGEFDRCTTADCPGGGGFGNYVQILHDDGKTTLYGHLKQWSVQVAVGDTVACGQLLGEVGSSGYSTGPHLHFEVRDTADSAEDPFDGPCSAPPSYWTSQGSYSDVPDVGCLDGAECEPVALLSCGDVLSGRSDGPGSASATYAYGCSDFVYSGPELAWSFMTDLDEEVSLHLRGLEQDLDLYVLDSAKCDGSDCRGASTEPETSDETVTFAAGKGVEYIVVVDGWEGAAGPFELEVQCVGSVPTEPTDPQPVDTGTPDDPPDDGGPTRSELTESGCSCGVPTGTAVTPVSALFSRRR
jgi:hypothetical protein